jgi:RNA polymerase sigma-70 factor (ECF subfamily)
MAESPLKRSQQDPRAFAQFYREHATAVAQFFARRIFDGETALDLTAETFAQAYAGRRRFRGDTDEEARGWLYVIAERQLAGYLRRGYADQRTLTRLKLQRPEASADELARLEELAGIGELRALLRHHMGMLPDGHREAVRLRIVEELPYEEVAQRLAITETAARMRVSRALAQLRAVMAPIATVKGVS